MNFVRLENGKLDVSTISDLVAHEACGAISLFVGTTRDNFEDKKVVSLEYEAFEPMAVKTMNAICDEMRTKWSDIKNIAIYHRLGSVPVKEASVVIAVSSPHRETSLLAVQHAIDTLKKSVPIWKKECYDDSQTAWKENKESFATSIKTRSKLNFEACPCDIPSIPKSLVQITADETELARRIQSFVEKKREEIDTQNISCFTAKSPSNNDQSDAQETCARVNSTAFRQKDSNGYLKVHRVKNVIGPQIKPDYTSTLNKLMGHIQAVPRIKQERGTETSFSSELLPAGLEERLENVEKILGYNARPAPRTIYERVKNVEDRLLYLESISPEYYHFMNEKPQTDDIKRRKKPSYSVEDLDRYIADIQNSI